MKFKFLIRNWSSVSAAAAVLLGSSNRASASSGLPAEGPQIGGGEPYEPLILKPPAGRTIPEEQFAAHTSHASHASHASHSSHYSGAGSYQAPTYSPPPSTPAPTYARPSPAASQASTPAPDTPTRIELANGTVMYGTGLVKSSAGITMKGSDGKTYKFERKQLSARTIIDLGLPAEERSSGGQTSGNVTTNASEKSKDRELQQTIEALRTENAALRAQTQGVAQVTPAVSGPAPATKTTYRVVGLPRNSPSLNIREGPGDNYAIIGSFGSTAHGIILGPRRISNGWTVWQEVSGNGYTGWVNAHYLAAEPTEP